MVSLVLKTQKDLLRISVVAIFSGLIFLISNNVNAITKLECDTMAMNVKERTVYARNYSDECKILIYGSLEGYEREARRDNPIGYLITSLLGLLGL